MSETLTGIDSQILTLINVYKLRFTPTDIKNQIISKYENEDILFGTSYKNNKSVCTLINQFLQIDVTSSSLKLLKGDELQYEVEKFANHLTGGEWDQYILSALYHSAIVDYFKQENLD